MIEALYKRKKAFSSIRLPG